MSQSITMLYVDGDKVDRLAVREAGRTADVKVLAVNDGRQGMGAARLYHPDLIVIASELPDMTAEEMLRLLKADRHLSSIPVIVTLAHPDQERTRQLRHSGAADCLVTGDSALPALLPLLRHRQP